MAITTLDQVIAGIEARRVVCLKQAASPGTVGNFISSFTQAGSPPAGTNPSTLDGVIPDKTATGALPLPITGGTLHLGRSELRHAGPASPSVCAGSITLYDRLWHNVVNATSTSLQSITQPALTRHTNGVGVELWIEYYATAGAATPTLTIIYTDNDGNTAQTAPAFVGTSGAISGRTIPIPLAADDLGVRAVESYQASASWISGTFGLVLRRKIAVIPIDLSGFPVTADPIRSALQDVHPDAFVEFVVTQSNNITNYLAGTLSFVEG